MADPVVTITNGVPTTGTGTITTLGQTLLDGAQVTQGAIADAAVTAGATGTVSAKLRALSRDMGSLVTAWGSTLLDFGSGTSGTRTQRVIMDSSQLATLLTSQGAFAAGAQQVSLPSDHPAIVAGGNVAHDAADSGNGLKQAAKATTSLAALTLVASADRTDLFAGVDGVQIVRPHCNLEDIVTAVVTSTTGANTSGIAAQGAGVKFYLCALLASNTGGAAGGNISVTDGSGGTEKANIPYTTLGVVENLPVPIPFSANTAVFVDPSGTDTMKVTLIGFKSKV